MGKINSMYGSIGSMATKFLHGSNYISPAVKAAQQAVRNAPAGGGSAAMGAFFAAKKGMHTATGKKVVGGAVAMGLLSRANKKRPVGGYNPRRPVMPVPQNGKRM